MYVKSLANGFLFFVSFCHDQNDVTHEVPHQKVSHVLICSYKMYLTAIKCIPHVRTHKHYRWLCVGEREEFWA